MCGGIADILVVVLQSSQHCAEEANVAEISSVIHNTYHAYASYNKMLRRVDLNVG